MWADSLLLLKGKDTYRHHQLKGMLVHPHRWLVFLHHDGERCNTNDLNGNENEVDQQWLQTFGKEMRDAGLHPSRSSEQPPAGG